jgi:hypothetical protein
MDKFFFVSHFQRFHNKPPFDLDFFLKNIEIEKYFAIVDKHLICDIYKEALTHFGKCDVNLWLNYIEFLYSNYQHDTKSIADAYWKAKKMLNEEYVDFFEQKFNLFKIQLDNKSLKKDNIDEIQCD